MRPTYAEIDLGAIASNVAALRDLIAPSQFCAVVKADAYGHGDVPVAATALRAGASLLAVALVEEGVRLREAGIGDRIMLLSEPRAEDAPDVVKWELEPTVYSDPLVEALSATRATLPVHLKIDTGMHRVGADPSHAEAIARCIDRSSGLELASAWTHFAVADQDPEYTRVQIERFDEVIGRLEPPMCHLSNTAGAVLFPDARRDMCRIGLGTYGLHPCPETVGQLDLRPAMRLVSEVSHVQRLPAGERPSYGRVRPLEREATVVTAPIGYADGFPRSLTTSGSALIGGRRFPLAGTVTMDQIVIDVGDESVGVGEEVVLLGAQAEEEISADEWAHALRTITYEVVCSIGPRVPRRYV